MATDESVELAALRRKYLLSTELLHQQRTILERLDESLHDNARRCGAESSSASSLANVHAKYRRAKRAMQKHVRRSADSVHSCAIHDAS